MSELTATLIRTGVGLAILMAITMVLLRMARIPFGFQALWAILRALIQLAMVALILRGVFTWPAMLVAFLVLMVTTASLTASGRLSELWHGRKAAFIGVIAGSISATGGILVLQIVEHDARHVISIAGIIIGNAMSGATLTGRNFGRAGRARAGEVEAWFSLGARPIQAWQDIARDAVKEAMIPGIDQTRSTGLVTLPGAFVGALFGGASPLEAARFQLVILVGILMAMTITCLTTAYVLSFSPVLPNQDPKPAKKKHSNGHGKKEQREERREGSGRSERRSTS